MAGAPEDARALPPDMSNRDVGQPGATPSGDGGREEAWGQADPSFRDAVLSLLNGLVTFPRTLRLYAAHHARIEKHAARLARLARRLLHDRVGPCELRVRGDTVCCDGMTIDTGAQVLGEFARLLRSRAVSALVFRPGIGPDDVRAVGEWFAYVPDGGVFPRGLPETPHLELVLAGAATSDEAQELVDSVGSGERPTRDALGALLKDIFERPSVRHRIRRLPGVAPHLPALDAHGAPGQVRGLVAEFLAGHDWASLPQRVLEATVRGLLDRIEEIAETGNAGAGVGSDIRDLRDLLGRSFDAAVEAADVEATLLREPLAPGASDDAPGHGGALGALLRLGLRDPRDCAVEMRDEVTRHCVATSAITIQCELIATSGKRSQYEHRRERLRRTIARHGTPRDVVARSFEELQRVRPEDPYESWSELVQDLAGSIVDPGALALVLAGMEYTQLEEARFLVHEVSERSDAFDMLTSLLEARLPDVIRQLVLRALAQLAGTRTETWLAWCSSNPDTILNPFVFGVLILRCPAVLVPVTKEFLTKGDAKHRLELIRLLVDNGGLRALRLLVFGFNYDDHPSDEALIDALGSFRHSLAVGVLREVVHRCNTGTMRSDEARRAVRALKTMEFDEADEFLEEMAGARTGLLPRYRRELRQLARTALAATEVEV
jgi:hypothetical protein